MILEILSIGLIISACLALFLDEVVYSVAALSGTFLFTALLYFENGAPYAAIFQFVVGVGTLAILFLSGEMLSDKTTKKTSHTKLSALIGAGAVLSLPAIFLSVSSSTGTYYSTTFGNALWNLSGVDVILQALVLLTVALGIAIILYERKSGGK
ncbi:MAG: NADH-quinone oxidoreductase subunit J [Candidatus Bathyarchaeia archaeon]|jgi:NADH:ubiquinone oxidoreductase subunit 6 (subunit J)